MIINAHLLLEAEPIKAMSPTKNQEHGVSWGLSEVGYDIRVKQEILWTPPDPLRAMSLYEDRRHYDPSEFKELFERAFHGFTEVTHHGETKTKIGRTAMASSVEPFQIPPKLWCEFRNKSTHARCFVDATLGTDGEPGWTGHLTIEIVFHDLVPVTIPAGSAILKAVFHEIAVPMAYAGKYQNQADRPVDAIFVENEA